MDNVRALPSAAVRDERPLTRARKARLAAPGKPSRKARLAALEWFHAEVLAISVGEGREFIEIAALYSNPRYAPLDRPLTRPEAVAAGMARAKARGATMGRRLASDAPKPARVQALRRAGCSWAEVAGRLGCSVSSARRAALRHA